MLLKYLLIQLDFGALAFDALAWHQQHHVATAQQRTGGAGHGIPLENRLDVDFIFVDLILSLYRKLFGADVLGGAVVTNNLGQNC